MNNITKQRVRMQPTGMSLPADLYARIQIAAIQQQVPAWRIVANGMTKILNSADAKASRKQEASK